MARRSVRVDGAVNELKKPAAVAPHDWHPTASRVAAQLVPEPHSLERLVMLELRSRFSFSSLVVRRTRDGVCLQGVMYWDEDAPDLTSTAQRIAGVEHVINQLVTVRQFSNEQVRKQPK